MVKRYEPCHKWYAYDNEPTLEMQESAYGEYVKLETFQHKMARLQAQIDRMRKELRRLEAANAELLESLVDVSYTLEKARIWGGMEWKYNPLHPVHYLPARDKARAAIKKHGGAA